MKLSIIIPCYNAELYIRDCIESILHPTHRQLDLEILVMDGASKDKTLEILKEYEDNIHTIISESDAGPADAINKGFALATGDVLAWLNADDRYAPGALPRAMKILEQHPEKAFCFGHCPIVNEQGEEIRKAITGFKELFYPISCRFTFQCINYLSQPACFFRADAVRSAGNLRCDLKAAWDYEFLLRIWRQGSGKRVLRPALAVFCWHPGSISGQHFRQQFAEEFTCASEDAGKYSLQTFVHWFVRWGIIGAYTFMNRKHRS